MVSKTGVEINKQFLAALLTLFALTGFPTLGLLCFGIEPGSYFAIPPKGIPFDLAVFSGWVFAAYALFIILAVSPFILITVRHKREGSSSLKHIGAAFPLYGYLGLILTGCGWAFAWTRLGFLDSLQIHTFIPLWFGLVLTLNALLVKRTGTSPLNRKKARYILLFFVSSIFWWLFEFLNAFSQNWDYQNVDHLDSFEYFLFASISFSTVLPAVAAVRELLLSFRIFREPFVNLMALTISKKAAVGLLVLALLSLFLLYHLPNLLFPILWVSPLIVLFAVQTFLKQETILDGLRAGDWSEVIQWATAALVCGFLWEMWNFYSYAKWIYHVPYVQILQIFEMPLLGYAGYLPFGIFCGQISKLVMKD